MALFIYILCFLIVLCLCIYLFMYSNFMCNFKNNNYTEMINNLIKTKNPYLDNATILWPSNNYKFMCENKPNKLNFDYKIKKDIIDYIVNAPSNSSVIDCGAHIGDGAIPIAQTLLLLNRGDITVYAIEPSKEKCEFIKTIANKNKLYNVKVVNVGLSDKNEKLGISKTKGTNSGGTEWGVSDGNKSTFVKLDSLNIKNIHAIHLDVEGFEYKALNGAENTISKNKPYISLEINRNVKYNMKLIDKFLSKYSYEMKYRLNDNYIFKV